MGVVRAITAFLVYPEQLYLYHFMPGSVGLYILLEGEGCYSCNPCPPNTANLAGEGVEVDLERLVKRAVERYNISFVFIDSTSPKVPELKFEDVKVVARSCEPVGVDALLLCIPLHNPKAKFKVEGVERVNHVEALIVYKSTMFSDLKLRNVVKKLPRDVIIHLYAEGPDSAKALKIYEELRQIFDYVYLHGDVKRTDTYCPKCKRLVLVREEGMYGKYVERCPYCNTPLKFVKPLREPPKTLLMALERGQRVLFF